MSKTGPIILVEDDAHDQDVMTAALKDNGVPNEVICFDGAQPALAYLLQTADQPFIILCDILMRGMNGLEFREAIHDNDYLRKKSIPFVFFTAAVSQEIVDEAYDLTVQGFIEKPRIYDELKKNLAQVIGYWSACLHPNSF